MKLLRLTLFVIFSVIFSSQVFPAIEKTIYATIGEKFTLNPWSDAKSSFSGYTCASTTCRSEDATAFTITNSTTTKTTYPTYNNMTAEGFYRKYKVEALKVGTYTIQCVVNCYKRSGTSLYVGNPTVAYHVVVTEKPTVVSISIPSNLNLELGDSYTFSPVIREEGAETSITWSSSNPSVASINNAGVLNASGIGTSVITCTASNGVSAQCTVTVNPIRVTGISLNSSNVSIEKGASFLLEALLAPENATNRSVVWSSSNSNVAIVSTDGVVFGASEGYANILATTTDGSNLSASCLVHVVAPKVLATSLTLDAMELTLTHGDNAMLTATLQPSNVSSTELAWTSSDESIVKVDGDGIVSALNIGEAVITVSTTDGSNLSTTCNVKVNSKSIESFDNVVYFNDVTVLRNTETTLELQLKNISEITAIQFDLNLPEGISLSQNANTTTYGITFEEKRADAATHTLNSALQEDGTIRVLCYSTISDVFLGNEGTVLYFPVSISDLIRGSYNIILQNIVITDKTGGKTNIDAIGSVLNVVEVTPGDANGDNEIDVADIVAVANYILGSNSDEFLPDAADYDNDGMVDVADIVNIANHILGGNTTVAYALTRAILSTRTVDATYSLEVLPFALEGEGSKTVTLDLYNPGVEFTAFQCDIYLPTGLTVDLNRRGTAYNFSFNTDAERTDATYHTLSSAKQVDGAIRVICYSTANEIFLGEDGALLNIPLTADASLEEGLYEFSIANSVLTYVNGVKVKPETYKGSIVIGDGGKVEGVKLYGRYTSEVLDEYTAAFGTNSAITNIDLTEAIYLAEDGQLATGNPNTIVYLAEGDALANESNVVIGDECANLVLTDGYAFAAPVAFSASQASYERELAEGKYGTIVLPFAPNTDDYVFYALASATDDMLTFDEVTNPVANTPYLYKLRDGKSATQITNSEVAVSSELTSVGTPWQMVGSFTNQTIVAGEDEDKYYYAYTSSDNQVHQVTNTLTVKPYRAYFTTSSTNNMQLAVRARSGEETLIDASEVDGLCPEVYYDLSGRRVENPVKGVYIVKGKKVVF